MAAFPHPCLHQLTPSGVCTQPGLFEGRASSVQHGGEIVKGWDVSASEASAVLILCANDV